MTETDLKKFVKTYKRNEDINYHGENIVLLAKTFGTPEDLALIKGYKRDNEKAGHNVHYKEGEELRVKLWNIALAAGIKY